MYIQAQREVVGSIPYNVIILENTPTPNFTLCEPNVKWYKGFQKSLEFQKLVKWAAVGMYQTVLEAGNLDRKNCDAMLIRLSIS